MHFGHKRLNQVLEIYHTERSRSRSRSRRRRKERDIKTQCDSAVPVSQRQKDRREDKKKNKASCRPRALGYIGYIVTYKGKRHKGRPRKPTLSDRDAMPDIIL